MVDLAKKHANVVTLLLAFIAINIVNQHVSGDPFREGKLIVFLFAALFGASVWIANRFNLFLGLTVMIAAAEWAYANGPLFGIVPVVGCVGFLYLGHLASQNEQLILLLLRASTIIQLVFCAFQMFGHQCFGGINPYFNWMLFGNLGHPIVLSAWMAAIAPLAYFYWSRVEFLIICAVCLYSGSTMGVMALVAGGAYVWWRRLGWPVMAAGILGFIALSFCVWRFPEVEFFSLSGRLLPWRRAVFWILQSPWVGYGPGSWSGMYHRWGVEYAREWSPMHSDALQLAFEIGLPGFLLFITGIYMILRKCSVAYGAVMSSLLINGVGAFPFHIPELAFVFCTCLSMKDEGEKIWNGLK